jgi:hypothetical protein
LELIRIGVGYLKVYILRYWFFFGAVLETSFASGMAEVIHGIGSSTIIG